MAVAVGVEFSWWDICWISPLWQLLSALERLSSLHPVSVLARKRLDVSFRDLGLACGLCVKTMLLRGATEDCVREEAMLEVSRAWVPVCSGQSGRRSGLGPAQQHADNNQTNTKARDSPRPANAGAVVAPFLSVRTAFDLYLKALDLRRGSQVICSALTIPDMVKIFEEHGLVPVPVDLDPDTLAPEPGALQSEIERRCDDGGASQDSGRRSRVVAIYVAHVFGAQVDMTQVAEIAARYGLLMWEDCAQVFTGLGGYLGHPDSDATFFSFGMIKRATALGGGIACIRDAAILAAMLREEAGYPSQSALTYLRRVLKCSMLLAFTTPVIYGIIIRTLGLLGIEHDEVVMKLSKGFPKNALLKAIRHRASIPLLQMLAWRISRYSPVGVEVRLNHCSRMLNILENALAPRQKRLPLARERRGTTKQEELSAGMGGERRGGREKGDGRGEGERGEAGEGEPGVGDVLPGIKAYRHTLWLYPVMVKGGSDRAGGVVEALLREGFDATRAPTSLMPIDRCTTTKHESVDGQGGATPPCLTPRCRAMMDSLVYLPLANNIPDSEVDRMAFALARALARDQSAPGKQSLGKPGPAGSLEAGNGSVSRKRGEALQSLVAFAFRLDVIVVSTAFSMLLVVSVVALACLL